MIRAQNGVESLVQDQALIRRKPMAPVLRKDNKFHFVVNK